MPIKRMVPNAWHIKEFYDGFNGTCTQASAAMCLASALGTSADHDSVVNLMLAMTREMIANGKAAANGAATVADMAAELRARGGVTATEWDYAGDVMPHDWHALLLANAGINPILLQLANAQGAFDAAGTREDGGVHYHAIAIMGIADEGYVVGDPNNPTVEQTFDIYPYPALQAAEPCGLIMLQVKGATPVSRVPDGWLDNGQIMQAPNGFHFVGLIREWVLMQGWDAKNLPLQEQADFGGGNLRQVTTFDVIHVQNGGTPWRGAIGEEWLADVAALDQAKQQLADLKTQLDNANARLAEPPTVVVNVAEQKAIAAIAAMKDALSA